jgi:phosphoglycolate phosphatase-like HAD superfamily hydrolase
VPQNLQSLQDALERFGRGVPYSTLQLYSGLDGDQTLQLVLPGADAEERQEILKLQGDIYAEKYLRSVQPFEGVRDAFRALAERGGRIALATDCKGRPLKHYLSLLKIDEFVSATACGDDVEHGKPDPRLVGVALRKLQLPASESVMIGDTPYDAEAGLEAGTAVAGVLTGGFAYETLRQAGCFAVAKDAGPAVRLARPRSSRDHEGASGVNRPGIAAAKGLKAAERRLRPPMGGPAVNGYCKLDQAMSVAHP